MSTTLKSIIASCCLLHLDSDSRKPVSARFKSASLAKETSCKIYILLVANLDTKLSTKARIRLRGSFVVCKHQRQAFSLPGQFMILISLRVNLKHIIIVYILIVQRLKQNPFSPIKITYVSVKWWQSYKMN